MSKEGKVKRWYATGVDCDMGEGPDGDYVLYEDYAKLEALHAVYKKRLDEYFDGSQGGAGQSRHIFERELRERGLL